MTSLADFFRENNRVAIAFSGGVDSAYLLYAAMKSGATVRAYYVKTEFQPQFELDDAMRLAGELNADMKIIRADILSHSEVAENPCNRCYFCKKIIFGLITEAAADDGFTTILDGTNASDEEGDRPGMKALREMKVLSPLREAGLTKDDIRRLSFEAGLFTWNKPSYACLATRIPSGERITAEMLWATEYAEEFMKGLGFYDFRIRYFSGAAKIQIKENQLPLFMENRSRINEELKKYYKSVLLDTEVRK